MKAAIFIVIVSTLLSWTSVGFAAAPKEGFFIGGAGKLFFVNGTGEVSAYGESMDFDATADLSGEGEIGLNWDNKLLVGIQPLVGYRFSPMLSVVGSYNIYFKKSSDYSQRYEDNGSWWEYDHEWEYSHRSIEVLALIYPRSNSRFFFMGGLEFLSAKIDWSITYTDPYYDDYVSEDDDASATGIVLGGGYEFPSSKDLNFYVAGQYSFAKIDEEMFGLDWEIDAGGFSAQMGLRYYVGGKETR